MKIAVSDLRPNPFRDLKNYPIDDAKVDALVQSIKSTEFWDNLLARKAPDGEGWELAYGVHRLRALKKVGIDEIDIPVRKLDDTTMVKIMAHENQTEWGHTAVVDQETVRTIVKAFGEGRIELPPCGKMDGHRRIAPSFTPVGKTAATDSVRPESVYTAETISKFLGSDRAGWPVSKIEAILLTLATIEKGLLAPQQLTGLTTHQAHQIAMQARRAEKESGDTKLAQSVGRRLADGMRSASGQRPGVGARKPEHRQAVTYHGARHVTNEMLASHRRGNAPKEYPPAGKAIPALAQKIAGLLESDSDMVSKIELVVEVRKELHAKDLTMLIGALRGLAKRAERLASRLGG